MKRLNNIALLLAALSCVGAAHAADEITVYTSRQARLIEPVLNAFTQDSGVKVNLIFVEKGLEDRIKKESASTPADVIITVDAKRLADMAGDGLTQPLKSADVEKNVPAQFRSADGKWIGLTLRARAVYSSKDRVGKLPAEFDYMTLADAKYKGKICTRPFKHPYNLSLIASMVAHHGEAETKRWLEGVKSNLARKPQGNDRDQIKAVKDGICDLSLGNSYYFGKMQANDEQRAWADAVEINFPGQRANGTHVNVSGIALANNAPNRENAVKLIAFLSGNKAQEAYAALNDEYPVNAEAKWPSRQASWGVFTADALPVEKIVENYAAAIRLVDETQFDR